MNIFKRLDIQKSGTRIVKHVNLIIIVFAILTLMDYIFHVFPATERYGLRSEQLFYSLHTYYAAICGFLLSMLMLTKKNNPNIRFYLIITLILLASTLRSKAFGVIALYIMMYYFVYRKKTQIKATHIIFLCLAGLVVGWTQIQYYFFSSIRDGAARYLLLQKSFFIANDHFPIGAGLGTYASYYSGVIYSPIYQQYGLSEIYGLTQDHPSFISDSFWPMILGQSGYFGFMFFSFAVFYLFKEIQKISRINRDCYFAALFALAYICVSSLAESAFVNPIIMPMAIIIGLSFNIKDKGNEL